MQARASARPIAMCAIGPEHFGLLLMLRSSNSMRTALGSSFSNLSSRSCLGCPLLLEVSRELQYHTLEFILALIYMFTGCLDPLAL